MDREKVKKAGQWLKILASLPPELQNFLSSIYGRNQGLIDERVNLCREILSKAIHLWGKDQEVAILRVPSRINLMGMHIEHKGGFVNHISLPKETFFVLRARQDQKFSFHNIKDKYPPRSFGLKEYLPQLKSKDWLRFLSESTIKKGDWGNYLQGIILRLQMQFPNRPLQGFEVVVGGDIPPSSGMSSSSSLAVGSCLATSFLNELPLNREEMTVLSGEGEWFVGTRGGAGDQGAMLLGKKDHILHLQFFPMRVEYLPFPNGYKVLICNSLKEASKAQEAKNIYNSRVATYDLGILLVKKKFPQFRDKINYLRDINAPNLGFEPSYIYEILKGLPVSISRKKLIEELFEQEGRLQVIFSSHDEPKEGYHVREVLLYGLSECARAERVALLCRDNDWKEIGRLMYIAHDGDRIKKWKDGQMKPFEVRISDEYLDGLKRDKVKLSNVSGWYRCSSEEQDNMVDIVKDVEGVLGARLTGAGLGGCIVVLVKEGQESKVMEELNKKYYIPRKLPLSCQTGIPIAGASFLTC